MQRADRAEADCSGRADVCFDRPARLAFGEFIWDAVTREERGLIIDMHVQVWLGRAAGIADKTDDLAGADTVSDLHPHCAGPHMRIKNVAIRRDLDDGVIAGRIVEIDRDGIFARVGNVFRHAVGHIDDPAGCDAVDWLAVAEIAVVLVFWAFPGRAHAINSLILHPIDRETLGDPGVSVVDKNGAPMPRMRAVVHGIACDPLAAQWRRDDERTLVGDGEGRQREVMCVALVVANMQRMLDCARRLFLAEIEDEKDDYAAARFDAAHGSVFRLRRHAEMGDHRLERRIGKFGLSPADVRLNGLQYITGPREIGDQHFVDEPNRAVLDDWRGLRQKRHIELRGLRIAGDGGRSGKQDATQRDKACKAYHSPLRVPLIIFDLSRDSLMTPKAAQRFLLFRAFRKVATAVAIARVRSLAIGAWRPERAAPRGCTPPRSPIGSRPDILILRRTMTR